MQTPHTNTTASVHVCQTQPPPSPLNCLLAFVRACVRAGAAERGESAGGLCVQALQPLFLSYYWCRHSSLQARGGGQSASFQGVQAQRSRQRDAGGIARFYLHINGDILGSAG